MIGKPSNKRVDLGTRMQSMTKIDFRVPQKIVGDYNGDSI
jgi:hypothetical protein